MGGIDFPNNWIGDLWDDLYLPTLRDDTTWNIGKKISEKSTLLPSIPGIQNGKAEAQAVYHCEEIVQNMATGKRAIVKVRMQVPPEFPPSLDPAVRAQLANRKPAGWTKKELDSLRHFNEKKCTVVPQQLLVVETWQHGPEMPVPNGYLIFIVMEKLPGVTLSDFWSYPLLKRDMIRASFAKSLDELFSFHGRPWDASLENLIYDEKTDKCYFIDFEGIDVTEDKEMLEFDDLYFYIWHLKHESYGKIYQ
ncbi:hypothetical protein EMCG_04243 [[Emmonsia] crescens]|uniref:Aminoglycoside phosphotransferase domain-containing protein n=1 Tax=[Emmonsia] crescens TaxID=73230 RepID=A0A0G2HSN4_9EURO|nr:hypothetical protein EMCG_04243 [Emmonsia crescens UAMH 3008]